MRRRRETLRLGQREEYEERDGRRRRETLRLGQREEYEGEGKKHIVMGEAGVSMNWREIRRMKESEKNNGS